MFFENLSHVIGEKYFAKIPFNSKIADSNERWMRLLNKLKMETVTDSEFWLNYWTQNPCTQAPTLEDKEYLKRACEGALDDFHFCLCTSLKELIANDYENLESTENLHQYHLLVKAEMLRRGIQGVTPTDSFPIDIANKNKGQLISMDKARTEGICPYCNSKTNVISYGDKWHCKKCKKYWRKA